METIVISIGGSVLLSKDAEINVKSEETELTKTGQTNNVHTYTISSPDVTKDSPITVTLSYKLPEQTESFQKKLLLNNTEEIS
ncbi:unnamed protein product, partial [marine sediment metagenome]